MTIIQKPDSLSLSENIKDFRIATSTTISFILRLNAEEIVAQSYEPGQDNFITINIREIVHNKLSFLLQESKSIYHQPFLSATFTATIDSTECSFTVVKAGVDRLADTATNFLTQNFLTWQPQIKPVTYYCPEFLTYYAVIDCYVKLKAYFTDSSGKIVSERSISLGGLLSAGNAYTIPMQYALVVEKLSGDFPAYYDIWIENISSERLTYIQRYYASNLYSEQEQWVLFENSIGGIDTFRAYGSTDFNAEHTHNIAEIEDVSLEYRIDTKRKFQKNTGYLDKNQRQWLLDFFPSKKKYIYVGVYLRPIVVVESNVSYTDKELPSDYTFTYEYADARPLLNFQRTEKLPTDLNISVPDLGSFSLPPRLVEFPHLPLSEGALFPVQNPYSERWSTSTAGSLADFVSAYLGGNYQGGGGIGHIHGNIDLLQLLSFFEGYIKVDNKKIKSGYSDESEIARSLETRGFNDESGARIDADGKAEFQAAIIRELLRSPKFVDGMFGEGFRLWIDKLTGLSNLTIDKVTIREALVAMELLIERIRSVGGLLVVSAANGKIKTVEKTGDNYIITFEQDNTFVANDLMRCAVLSGIQQRGYWVEIAAADTKSITVPIIEFKGTEPIPGDECVLMGNTKNKLRQNLISISATDDGQPRIDVMDGISGKNFNDCLRVRLGNLDGINDNRFPLDSQPSGNGFYGNNVFLVGAFRLTTGEDVLTKFEIVEGKISSAVEGLRTDFTSDKSYLDNASFVNGLNKWDTENEATFFLLGNRWIWANNATLSNKSNYASVRTDDGRTTVFIRNKYILQKHENFRTIPEYKNTNLDGEKIPEAIYLSFFYKCTSAGLLKVTFENADKTGFEKFNLFAIDEEIEETNGYVIFNRAGLWNGTGDFKLSFTGDMYLYMLILSTDRAEALAYKYKTLFEQSEKLIKIAATNFDANGVPIQSSQIITKADMNLITSGLYDDNGNIVKGAGLITTAEANKMFAFDAEGNLVSFIEQTAAEIKIKASQITFEGLITANSYFKILEDGSIEAQNANIKNGKIGGFILANGRIGAEATANGNGGSLAIYEDFFQVGGNYGYVMFGDDVIPADVGGAFTATGRIVNNHPNINGGYGYDQANYGLFISVSGGTKNYGISSNAALRAPSFINTKAELLTFGNGMYKVDFSQKNIILMYYNQPNFSIAEVTLPDEASVAKQFGMDSLPADFATVVTFRVRPGSKAITLLGIYNHNEKITNYEMGPGDSIVVLISKIDGFRYQILNHSS